MIVLVAPGGTPWHRLGWGGAASQRARPRVVMLSYFPDGLSAELGAIELGVGAQCCCTRYP